MCGRYTLSAPHQQLQTLFEFAAAPEMQPRYNIAPTQAVPVVRLTKAGGERELTELRWGLIPSWAKDPSIGNRMINARAETVAEKPSFRSAFKRQRCLVVADGFYEWQKSGKTKQPFHISLADGTPFAFAGLWERWEKGDAPLESCTIITTEANELVRPVHQRMPVILPPSDYAAWLDPGLEDRAVLQALLRQYPATAMRTHPVSTHVNSPRNDDVQCIAPLTPEDAVP